MVALLYSRTLQSVKIESANFLIAFIDDLGNFKHFEPYLFFRTFDFYTLQSVIVKQRYHRYFFFNSDSPSRYVVYIPILPKSCGAEIAPL